ncbi:hypothetical protein SAMN05421856_10638 [Chryseobacterium taichungense]|uniref:Uncharacterized protein n=1 Tax=Chryseobacterium taichungense TaxID=295069 RepID=A0A1H8AU67_9FLAO|nr:hypothetical protein SAMN05421856_10638 [Chryseobacterium taichungense]
MISERFGAFFAAKKQSNILQHEEGHFIFSVTRQYLFILTDRLQFRFTASGLCSLKKEDEAG